MATPDQTLLSALQIALVEPPDGGATWVSDLWGRGEVIALANQRQDRLLKDTLLLVNVASPQLTVGVGVHRIALPADWLRTLSVVWVGSDSTVRELVRVDSKEADATLATWESTNTAYPLAYMDEETPHLQIQIAPAPTVSGVLDLLYVALGSEMNGNGVNLTVPDELEHAVRYGVLADLLSKDGRGKDAARAGYCAQRFDLAVEATNIILRGWA